LSGGTGEAGTALAMGDVNGDDKADILIGGPGANSKRGAVYLVLGNASPVSINLNADAILIHGGTGEAGTALAMGDVNGDGKADMLIGAPVAYLYGAVYLVLGGMNLNNINLTTDAILLYVGGGANGEGLSLAIGDVNRDGKADMLIGAPSENQAYLVLGSLSPMSVDLSTDAILLNEGADGTGSSLALGDVNGDGKADMLVGTFYANQAYLVYGGPPPEPTTICSALTNLNSLGSGILSATGFQLTMGARSTGTSLAIGDVNGDGKADMLLGAPFANQAYLVLGSINASDVNLSTNVILFKRGVGNTGTSLAIGDVNGDGKADMLLGAPFANQAYLVLGSANLTDVNLAVDAFLLHGGTGGAGLSLAIGDVNGDGKSDMLIGAYGIGGGYLVLGSATPKAVDLGNMTASTGVLLSGGSGGAGWSVAIGDMNGDGKGDMLLGGGNQTYLVFGSSNPIPVNNLANMENNTGFILSECTNNSTTSVAMGDVNGDGKADMLIGVPGGDYNYGTIYLVLGSVSSANVNLTTDAILLHGGAIGDNAGTSLALGDVNGDGKADMLIGAPGGYETNGVVYLAFGSINPSEMNLNTSAVLLSGDSNGEGSSLAIGEVNGDGKADMLIGAPGSRELNRVSAYLVFGSQTPWLSSSQSNSIYNQGDPPQLINPYLALDENGPIISANVSISENYKQGDFLEIISALPPNITANSFDILTGAITINGTAPAYIYQQVLDSVVYFNNASTMKPLPRTITFQANDGMICGVSNQFNHTIYINATTTSAPTPTPTTQPSFTPSQLAMLIALPIGGFFLLALVFSLYMYRRYQERHEFDEDAYEDIEAQPLLTLSSFTDTIADELNEEPAIERNAREISASTGERLYQQALRCEEGEEKNNYLEQAIAQGHIAAQIELAQLYERGLIGVQAQGTLAGDVASLNKAIELYAAAEAQGNMEAAYHIPRVCHRLAQAYQALDVRQALSYYYKAAAAGYFPAQASLAQWVADGLQLDSPALLGQIPGHSHSFDLHHLQVQLKSHTYGVQAKQADANKDKQAALELLGKAQQTDAFNRTLLHLAVLYGCDYCIKTLIKQGASVSLLDASGKTPLDIAKQQGSYQLITLLEEERVFEQNNAKNEERFQQLLTQLQSSRLEEEEEELDAENQEELLQAQAHELRRQLLDITELDQLLDSREALREEAQALDDYREKAQRDILVDLVKRLKTPTQMLAKHSHNLGETKAALKKTRKHLTFLCKHIEAAKKHFNLEDNQLILALLNNLQAYYQNFLDQLNAKRTQGEQLALFAPKAVIYAAGDEFRFRHLKLEAQQKLIGQTGERDNQHGIHEVKEYNGVHYKLQPYAPGVEYMVNSLAEIIAGQGTSPTALINISYRDNYIYQASKTVIGVNLEHIVLCHPELIEKIDARNFSEMFTLDLITDPQDGKADNRMARVYLRPTTGSGTAAEIERLRLVGIDNDIAFADPVVKQHRGEHKDKHYINVKNILYFFPQMNNIIHPEFRQHFLSHSPEVIIIQWLEALAKKNEEYQALLDQGVLNEEQLAGLQLPIKLVPGLALKLKDKIQKMQEIMRQQPELTHKQLLNHIEPVIQKYYQAIQEKEPNPWRATFKLYKAAVASVEDKLSLETRISSRHRLMTELAYHHSDQDAFEDNRTQTIQAAMEEFITAINLPEVENSKQKSPAAYIGKLYLIEHLLLTNDSLLARISLPELVQRFPKLKKLSLNGLENVITNDIIVVLLKSPNITLRLGNCPKVSTPKDWLRIYQDCKHFILLVGNLELNISEEEPDAILRRCEEAGVATDAIRQFMRMLSMQEKKGVSAIGSSTLSRYRSKQTPKTKFFPTAKATRASSSSSSSSSSQSRSANDKF
jgi:TPR repeat protein